MSENNDSPPQNPDSKPVAVNEEQTVQQPAAQQQATSQADGLVANERKNSSRFSVHALGIAKFRQVQADAADEAARKKTSISSHDR